MLINRVMILLLTLLQSFILPTYASEPGTMPGYDYKVTDIAKLGLNSQQLFDSLPTKWMDLDNSTCSKRTLVWSYYLKKKYNINPGLIFVFFGKRVWEGHKKQYWYHAGTYVVENGVEKFLEASYPNEFSSPLTLYPWMAQEMEYSRTPIDSTKCVEITPEDTDLLDHFLSRGFFPNQRDNGKPAYDCYYKKVPPYLAYPGVVGELELGHDVNGQPTDYTVTHFEDDWVFEACVDARSGGKRLRRSEARSFCSSYLQSLK